MRFGKGNPSHLNIVCEHTSIARPPLRRPASVSLWRLAGAAAVVSTGPLLFSIFFFRTPPASARKTFKEKRGFYAGTSAD